MPFYEFKCTNDNCDYLQEELVKMGEYEIDCPKCKEKAKKTINSYRFVATNLPNGHHAIRNNK
jgi:putative FmdB family regulatory protein